MASTLRAAASQAAKALRPTISLHGRHCLITGGSGALGASIAADMARAGACVTLIGRNEDKLRSTLQAVSAITSASGAGLDGEPQGSTKVGHKYLVVGRDGDEIQDVIAVSVSRLA